MKPVKELQRTVYFIDKARSDKKSFRIDLVSDDSIEMPALIFTYEEFMGDPAVVARLDGDVVWFTRHLVE